MGCDIHGWIEKRVGNKWVAYRELEKRPYSLDDIDPRARNYARFAALAGVRGDGPDPKGLPLDISETTQFWVDEWDTDGHSHSWLSLDEAARIFLDTEWEPSEFARKWPATSFFGVDYEQDAPLYRLVFWFDN